MKLSDCHNIDDFRLLAKQRLPWPVFDYIDGAADDELTKGRNTASFADCDLVPDVLAGVDTVAFTTLQPGMLFGFTDHDVRIDNVRVERTVPSPADLNGDGAVNGDDLGMLLGAWGPAAGSPADLNHDGMVDGTDLGMMLAAWTTP